jgi:hypothetical protein
MVLPYHLAIRYTTPLLIALAPAALALLFQGCLTSMQTGRNRHWRPSAGIGLALLGLGAWGIVSGFAPALVERASRIAAYRTGLAFPAAVNRAYLAHQRTVFSRQKQQQIRRIQHQTAAGSTLLVYIATPFHLDFKRNRIFSVGDVSGLTASRLGFPLGSDLPVFQAFLKQKGIRYVWWQYRGLSMRRPQGFEELTGSPYLGRRLIGLHGKYLLRMLTQLSRQSAIVFQNDEMVVFEL